ncbi:MAG: bifunctional diaminohydroxyphosphoribosylaminopyrimidine deaminase/5-amino-6-(5-phosphoribosylamino)uracil reductase RibD [Legionellaceae bacterium]|nr:bifunctional diaminohydroxyphosphoribosylaminopyrimidine deaminase/5-amino-6-(5-phosphoribosylamino)uracil reductase RibD [Legionellaceae bacterium]
MHKQFLLTALEQAQLGRGACAPNPSVGAVAVQNNTIIAQAWHRGAGTPHAEQLLLRQLPQNCSDVTLYVTLEPCNHWGRTPPCVDAIIKQGIQRVVYAYRDPNPIVSCNNSPNLLKEQGIDVVYYPLPEIDRFYTSYKHWILTKKPWVTVKMAQTFDGKIAGAHGERLQLSNAKCSEFTHAMRLQADVILTTARTINQDDPLLNARVADGEQAKPLAIIDARLAVNKTAQVFRTAQHCFIYHDSALIKIDDNPNCTFYGVKSVQKRLDLTAIVCHLGSLGYHDVWVEAGGELFSALHQAGLVNRTYIYLVPMTLGDAGTTAYRYGDVLKNPRAVSWQAMDDNMIAVLDW